MSKLSTLNVVRCRGLPIFRQLQAEEILLRATNENWFLFNTDMTDLSIVLGFSGKVRELVDVDRVRRSAAEGRNVTLIRRYTGGGTVIVDESTVFTSFIMNATEVPSKPFPRDIMNWSETIFKPVFEDVSGMKTKSGTNAAFALRENDYILDSLKIGGNAQSIVKDRWVHHTSFLWDYREENMQYLLMPKKRPDYRNNRTHTQFLDKICNHVATRQELEDAMIRQLRLAFNVQEHSQEQLEKVVGRIRDSHCTAAGETEAALADADSLPKRKQLDVRTRLEFIDEYASEP